MAEIFHFTADIFEKLKFNMIARTTENHGLNFIWEVEIQYDHRAAIMCERGHVKMDCSTGSRESKNWIMSILNNTLHALWLFWPERVEFSAQGSPYFPSAPPTRTDMLRWKHRSLPLLCHIFRLCAFIKFATCLVILVVISSLLVLSVVMLRCVIFVVLIVTVCLSSLVIDSL